MDEGQIIEVVTGAIAGRRRLRVRYGGGTRTIEPHALGRGKDGQALLRAFLAEGHSASGIETSWKMLRLDDLKLLTADAGSFSGPRDGYRRGDPWMAGGIIAEI